MARILRNVLQMGPLVALLLLPALADERPPLQIFVYNDAEVPSRVVELAEADAAKVLARAGISTEWHECLATREARCELSGATQLAVRLVPKSTNLSGKVFGAAYLSPQGEGRYTDVFFSEIKGMQSVSRLNLAKLLGHVMVHELGHLLLGSNAHAVTGIMRAQWQEHELKQIAMGTLFFSPEQSARMQQRVGAHAKLSASSEAH